MRQPDATTRTPARRPRPNTRRRRGFTMTELMIAIGIMLLLVGLSVGLLGRMGGTAREKATRGTIEKINTMIADRSQAFERSITNGELRAKVKTLIAAGYSAERAEIEVRKNEFKIAFPQSFLETNGELAPTDASKHTAKTESAEVLYWLLTDGGSYGFATVGSDQFTANEVKDTDGDGLLEFVDAWEEPLRYYRWPTRLVRPNGTGNAVRADIVDLVIDGANAALLDSDPDDPKGLYSGLSEVNYHTPNTYHTVLLVSGGGDGDIGLFEPTDTANFGHLAQPTTAVLGAADPGDSTLNDNITNRQRLGNE